MERILVTGGAGFIGSHIADFFCDQGHEVFVIDDLSSGSLDNLNKKAKFIKLDIRSKEMNKTIVGFKPDVIIHAAAQMSVTESMKNPYFDADVNVLGLVNILQAIKENELNPYFIFISTGGAMYGDQAQCPASEDHPIQSTSFYGLSKRVSEMYLELWNKSYKLNYSVTRLSNIYGPRQNPHGEAGVVAIFCNLLLAGNAPRIFGNGEQTRDYLFVGDVVQAIAKLSKEKINGIFNIGTARETSVNNLLKEITEAINIKIEPQYLPARLGEQQRSSIDANKAKKAFGWEAKYNLKEGLKITADWFKQKHSS